MKLHVFLCTVALALGPSATAAARPRGSRADDPSFPMRAAEYRKLIDKRLDGVWGVIEKKLDRRGVSPDRKKAIRQLLDDVSGDVRAEVAAATADGTVTDAEAAKTKARIARLRGKLRARLAAEKKQMRAAKARDGASPTKATDRTKDPKAAAKAPAGENVKDVKNAKEAKEAKAAEKGPKVAAKDSNPSVADAEAPRGDGANPAAAKPPAADDRGQ